MPDIDGVNLSKILRNRGEDALLIFCSGKVMPSPEMFKVNAFRFIVKFDNNSLYEDLQEIIEEAKKRQNKIYINAITDGKVIKIKIDYITYIATYLRKTRIYLSKEGYENLSLNYDYKIYTKEKIINLYEILKNHNFGYPHISYIVNFDYIIQATGEYIKLIDGTELNISRSKKEEFNNSFANYIGSSFNRRK